MKNWKRISLLLISSSTLTLSTLIGCMNAPQVPIDVYDRENCAVLGKVEYPVGSGNFLGAECNHAFVTKVRHVPYDQWINQTAENGGSVGMICTDSQGFTDIETELSQACDELPCDYKTRDAITHALERIRPLSALARRARRGDAQNVVEDLVQ